jgi:hypothetical protein
VTKLCYKSWNNIFIDDDVDTIFNAFLNTYLRIFLFQFSFKTLQSPRNKAWVTAGIKTSCNHKRELYLVSRKSSDLNLTSHYKSCCRILSNVSNTTKELHYNRKILNPNKIKAMWNIIKPETGRKLSNYGLHLIY